MEKVAKDLQVKYRDQIIQLLSVNRWPSIVQLDAMPWGQTRIHTHRGAWEHF
jgi:hypothetical protein